jgi:hypothetical protein
MWYQFPSFFQLLDIWLNERKESMRVIFCAVIFYPIKTRLVRFLFLIPFVLQRSTRNSCFFLTDLYHLCHLYLNM